MCHPSSVWPLAVQFWPSFQLINCFTLIYLQPEEAGEAAASSAQPADIQTETESLQPQSGARTEPTGWSRLQPVGTNRSIPDKKF